MRLAVTAGYGSRTGPIQEITSLVQEAEALGFHSAWVPEAYAADGATVLAWLAAHTTRIRLGSGIFQIPGRSPALTAMTAATLDRMSGGRCLLGLGVSGPQVVEGWHGQRFSRSLQRTREYVAVVRQALTGERGPEHLTDTRLRLAEGAARTGRALNAFDLACTAPVSIDEDLSRARDALRPGVALHIGGMGTRHANFYNRAACRYGFADAAAKVQELYLSGRRAEAEAAVPDELIDAVSACGPPSRVAERLAAYREAGIGTLIVNPHARTAEARIRALRTLAALEH